MSSPSYPDKRNGTTQQHQYEDDGTVNGGNSGGDGMTSPSSSSSSSSTQITIQLNTDMTAAQRFPTWILLCVSSIICVLALHSRRGILDADGSLGNEAWILSVGAISFLLSLSAIVMYLCFRSVFVGNIFEAIMVRSLYMSFVLCCSDMFFVVFGGFPNILSLFVHFHVNKITLTPTGKTITHI
jgi:hypothetical protein